MNIAVLSGKGGTGKTMVSVNLATVAGPSVYIDCDVEEPNGHLYLRPEDVEREAVDVLVPKSDPDKCDGCMRCVEFCRFNALAYTLDRLTVFTEMCHSCGGCKVICPKDAITEYPRTIGYVESGKSDNVKIHTGIMNIGEVAGIPIINRLLEKIPESGNVFIDCPPGSSCSVMESIKDADFCVLVSEPTVFGAHNLNMVTELVTVFGKPFGVILNKDIEGERNPSEEYCIENNLKILGRIPFDKELGLLSSEAVIAARENPKFRNLFTEIFNNIREAAL
ncbi:MAG: 4Fe-4S binding protein [Candidatus Methanomethylophilaceae archaeon]|jgi:MinD superfamily P-loop ATPase